MSMNNVASMKGDSQDAAHVGGIVSLVPLWRRRKRIPYLTYKMSKGTGYPNMVQVSRY